MSEAMLLLGVLLGLGFLALEVFRRTKISQVIILIFLGIILGPLTHTIDVGPDSLIREIAPFISTLALIFLLFDAGLNLDLRSVFKEFSKATIFTLVVFFSSAFVMAVFAFAFLGLDWLFALLLGFITGGVSSAIVIAIVEKMEVVGENVKTLLSLESTFTDILVVIFSLLAFNMIVTAEAGDPINIIFATIAVSLLSGILAYAIWLFIFSRVETHNFSYMLTVAVILFLYALAERTGGNGGFSVFIFGLILGNFSLLEKYSSFLGGIKGEIYKLLISEIKRFDLEMAFFIRTFLFILTGLMISFEGITFQLLFFSILLTLLMAALRYPIFKFLYKDESEFVAKFVSVMVPRGLAAIVVVNILPELAPPESSAMLSGPLAVIGSVSILIVLLSNILASTGVFLLSNGISQKPATSEDLEKAES